jgi:hypothetical protein
LLLDSGNTTLDVKELGGTGRVHDWEISSRIRDQVDCPLILAGGIRASNVRHAMTRTTITLGSSRRQDAASDTLPALPALDTRDNGYRRKTVESSPT